MSNWKERMWNQIKFGTPITNKEMEDIVPIVMILGIIGLVIWGIVELIKWIV